MNIGNNENVIMPDGGTFYGLNYVTQRKNSGVI